MLKMSVSGNKLIGTGTQRVSVLRVKGGMVGFLEEHLNREFHMLN